MKAYVTLQIRTDPETPAYIKAAATKAGDSMNHWCESRLIAAAQAELGGEGGPTEPEKEPGPPAVSGGFKGGGIIPDAARRFAEDFRSAMQAAHPGWKLPTPQAFHRWCTQAKLVLAERDEAEARELAEWLFGGEDQAAVFWRANILSLPKFREKYDQLQAKRRMNGHRSQSPVQKAMAELLQENGRVRPH